MPSLPRQTVPMLAALEEELRFSPREAKRRAITRAEALCRTLDDQTEYPASWVVAAVTGFRPAKDALGVERGSTLRRGMAAFVERESALAEFTEAEMPGGLSVADLLVRWKVSRATLGRMRALGLPSVRVRAGRGPDKVVFTPETVTWFERAHAARLGKAGEFSRLTPEELRRLRRHAARYAQCLKWPMTRVVKRLAQRAGRSQEGIRQALLRDSETSFDRTPHLDAKRRRLLVRAWRLGIDTGVMARKVSRSRGAVRRAINVERGERLRALAASGALAASVGPTFAMKDAGDVILAPAAVREGLGLPGAASIADVLRIARSGNPPIVAVEKHRAVAFHFLTWRAARLIATLNAMNPKASALDRIETDLRWACRLRGELARAQWAVIVRALEGRLGRQCEDLPARALGEMLLEAVLAAAGAVDSFDPFRGGRLAGPVGLVVDRVGASWAREGKLPRTGGPGRAALVLGESARLDEWTQQMRDWQRWLEPPSRVLAAVLADTITPNDAAFLRARFGWGERPSTHAELLARFKMTLPRIGIEEARATRAASH